MKISKVNRLLPFLLIVIHYLVLTQIQFIAWPEMFSYPYLLSKGYLIYKDIINPYPPILSWILQAFYIVLGTSLFSLKAITYIFILITDLLVFKIVKKILNFQYALFSLLIYILLQSSFEGNGLWFDLALTPILLFCFYIFYNIHKLKDRTIPKHIYLLGTYLSLAFLIKQTVGFFVILSGLLITYIFRKNRNLFKFLITYIISLIVPLLITSLIVYKNGIFNDYLFWVFRYPFVHLQSTGFKLFPTLKQIILLIILLFPLLFFITQKIKVFIISFTGIWFLVSLSFIYPRFSYFHLQPCLPYIAILISYLLFEIKKVYQKILIYSYLFIILIIFSYFFSKYFRLEPRFYNRETINISKRLNNELINAGEVFFYNTSSEFFVIGKLLPSKPWVDTFPWYLETKEVQKNIIKALENNRIEFVVYREFGNETSFTPGSYVPSFLDQYIRNNYQQYKKISENIWILKRKS